MFLSTSVFSLIFVINSFLPKQPVQAAEVNLEPEKQVEVVTPENVEKLIRVKARQSNIDEDKAAFIASCESELKPRALGDGNLICRATGKPMRSRGIWQINECGHDEVSDQIAFDPALSTDWAIKVFQRGAEAQEWKTCTARYQESIRAKRTARR